LKSDHILARITCFSAVTVERALDVRTNRSISHLGPNTMLKWSNAYGNGRNGSSVGLSS
jgi:hypothetical protein